MARVTIVRKARKDQGTCGSCGNRLLAGNPYRWWKFNFGPKYKRCMEVRCNPSRSALTQSEYYASLYSAEDDFNDSLKGAINVDCVREALRDAASAVEDIRSETEDKHMAMEEHFPQGCPNMELLQERMDACETLSNDLDSLSDDIEGSYEACAYCDDGEEYEDCDDCQGTGHVEVEGAMEPCGDCIGEGVINTDCSHCGGDWEEDVEGAIDEASTSADWDQAHL